MGISNGQTEQGARAVHKGEGTKNLTSTQLE